MIEGNIQKPERLIWRAIESQITGADGSVLTDGSFYMICISPKEDPE